MKEYTNTTVSHKSKKVTIIVPVYADWQSLRRCINSLSQYAKGSKIMLVNDSGPEADDLEEKINNVIKDKDDFYYYRNPGNLGFVKTCNRAVLELDGTDNDILLLNSDTVVTKNFLNELKDVAYQSKNISCASPRSNNATICTVPITSMRSKGIPQKASYMLWRSIKHKLPKYVEVPTAHGFCMYIKKTAIDKYGLFDEVFDRGYGEENDFSLRLKKDGYISVISNYSYVFHDEAKSFDIKKKHKLIADNRKIIDKRYPDYSLRVRDYIKGATKNEKILYPFWFKPLNLIIQLRNKIS